MTKEEIWTPNPEIGYSGNPYNPFPQREIEKRIKEITVTSDGNTFKTGIKMEEAKRFSDGKIRMDLVPPILLEEVAKIMGFGADKYGAYNYLKGMKWSKCIASLKRHLNEFEKGVDYDNESKELHISHVIVNALFLLQYYKEAPQFDDRQHWYKKPFKRIYLDLDGVVADFEKHFLTYFNLPEHSPTDWNDYRFRKNIHKICNNEDFWLSCPPLIKPEEIIYPITGYCTARDCSKEIIEKWLDLNKFPAGEILNVGLDVSKIEILKEKCDIFLDDSIKNFVELNSNGINCYLMSRPHNIKYNVGVKRINRIYEFFSLIL